MSAADIWGYCVPFINALAPAIFLIAIITNARLLIDFIMSLFRDTDMEDY
jgi:hypothetical protein